MPEPKRYSLRFAPNMALNGLVAPLVVVPALTRLPALTRDGAFETVGTVAHPNATITAMMSVEHFMILQRSRDLTCHRLYAPRLVGCIKMLLV